MVVLGADAAERWLSDGIDEAMNAFNGVDLTMSGSDVGGRALVPLPVHVVLARR